MRNRARSSRTTGRLAALGAALTTVTLLVTAAALPSTAARPDDPAGSDGVAADAEPLAAVSGLHNNDTDPGTGPLVSFGEFPRAALDYQRRSVGLDLNAVQTVRGLRLVDNDDDAATRLTAADYTLWASDDNVTYTAVTGWSLDVATDTGGHVVHTFAGFEAQARYVKVNTRFTDTSFTFTVDLVSGIRAYDDDPPPPEQETSAALDIVERGLAFDDPAISAFRPAITRAPNGDILAAFNTTGDVNPGGTVNLIRSTDDGRTWGPAEVLMDPTVWPDGSIYSSRGMTTLSDGTILLPINEGVNHSMFNNRESRLFVARSTDSGHTWTGLDAPVEMPVEVREHWACCSRILELDDGSLLLPLWGTLTLVDDWQYDPDRWRAAVIKSYDGGHTWTDYSTIAVDPNNPAAASGLRADGVNEPSITQLPDGRLVAMLRYAPHSGLGATAANLYISYSDDRGATWSPPQASTLRGTTPSLALAPCTNDLGSDGAKLIFGYRTPGNQAGVSVSYDAGVTWTDEILLQQPGTDAYIAAESDFLPLEGNRLLTLFQYRVGSGTYKLGYNVLQDAGGADCAGQLQDAERRADQFPTVFIERADRDDWPFGVALRQRTFPASTSVADVLATGAEGVVCTGAELYLTDASGARLDPGQTLADADVRNGDVLTVHSADPGDPTVDVGHAELDTFPQTRHLYGWAGACDYSLPFDSASRTVGLRVDVPAGQAVTSVSLRDTDATTRLTEADYELWTSADNETYVPLQAVQRFGWVDNDIDPATGDLAHLGHASGFALDYAKRSVGADLGESMTVTEVALHDADQSTRLRPEDLQLWVSDDNAGHWRRVDDAQVTYAGGTFVLTGFEEVARYVKVTQPYTDTAYTFDNQLGALLEVTTAEPARQWTFTSEVVDSRVVHTFSGLAVHAPYLKIHQRYASGAATFVIGSMRDDVIVTFAPHDACPDGYPADRTIVFGDQDSGVANRDGGDGCTFLDLVDAAGPFDDHGDLVRTVRSLTEQWRSADLFDRQEAQRVLAAAASSSRREN